MPSGADLEYARMLAAAGLSNGAGIDGALLEQLRNNPGINVLSDGFASSLKAGITTGVAVVGDSTGNDNNEWPYLLMQDLAARYDYTVQRVLWSDALQELSAPSMIKIGSKGEEYLDTSSGIITRTLPVGSYPGVAGTLDVRVKVAAVDWTPASISVLVAKENGAGNRSWYLGITTAGSLSLWTSVDGTNLTPNKYSTVPVPAADNSIIWVRAVYVPGASLTYYTSTDGITWTQLGTVIAHTEGVLFDAVNAPYELGGRQTGSTGASRIYSVDIRDNGKPIVPRMPSLWGGTNASTAKIFGSPTLTLVNVSHPGAGMSYWTQSKLEKGLADYGQRIGFISLNHNEVGQYSTRFTNLYVNFINTIKSLNKGIPLVALTQNPESSPRDQVFIDGQAYRRIDIITAASAVGIPVIDIFSIFNQYDVSSLNLSDGVHPSLAGSTLWKNSIVSFLGLR